MKSEWVLRTAADRNSFIAALSALPLDKPLAVTVKPYCRKRTTPQNSTYWWRWNAVAGEIANISGHTVDEVHEIAKALFCPVKPKRFTLPSGEEIVVAVRSTTLLDTLEMNVYMERCCAWAAETFGVELPEPIPAIVRMDLPEECEG